MSYQRLANEIRILERSGYDVSSVVGQLVEAEFRAHGAIPPPPKWKTFEWPEAGEIDLEQEWYEHDHEQNVKHRVLN